MLLHIYVSWLNTDWAWKLLARLFRDSTGPPMQATWPGSAGINLLQYTVSPDGSVWMISGWMLANLCPRIMFTLRPKTGGMLISCSIVFSGYISCISLKCVSSSNLAMAVVTFGKVMPRTTWCEPSLSGIKLPHSAQAFMVIPEATLTGIGPLLSLQETSSSWGIPSTIN